MVCVLFIVEYPTVTEMQKSNKQLFLYLNIYLSAMLISLSCSFTSIYFLTDKTHYLPFTAMNIVSVFIIYICFIYGKQPIPCCILDVWQSVLWAKFLLVLMICFLVYGIGLNPYHFGLDKYSIDPHDSFPCHNNLYNPDLCFYFHI